MEKYGIINIDAPIGGAKKEERNIMSKNKMYEKFMKAACLLLPDLAEDDYRVLELASYAKEKYYSNPAVPIVVMCSINGHSNIFKDFYRFCRELGIDTERREAIISDGKIYYTSDYSKWPTNVILK